jgi:membrane-associated progesterone receptor component
MDAVAAILYALAAFVGYLLLTVLRALFCPQPLPYRYEPAMVGDVTAEELAKHDGRDPSRALLLAVRGRVFDITEGRSFYGPGAPYAAFGGRECARALGRMAVDAAECTAELGDLTEKQLETLAGWERKLEAKYRVVGRVVPARVFTAKELAAHDGAQEGAPIYLSVRGVVFDVTAGRDFYGAGGAYPFGGRECARSLAKFSTEVADCSADLEGCSAAELDALADWTARFQSKYAVVGRLEG